MNTRQGQSLFQQKALDKLHSPEQLDKVFVTTTSVGWVALGCMILLIFSGLIWSIFGSISDKVNGSGLIVDFAGMTNITHPVGGRLLELKISVGDRVSRGQVIAVLEQSELDQEIASLRSELSITTDHREMAAKVIKLHALVEKHADSSLVISPYNGIIAEDSLNIGDYVPAGSSFAGVRLDQGSGDMFALIYVPVMEGKKVQPGMTAQIAPGSVDSSEYGTLIGRVTSVSDYPVPVETMTNWTGNKELSNWILQNNGGAVMEVKVDLIKDETPSGYLWSSVLGAPHSITPGTACVGNIIVKRQSPIVKVFNKFSQWLRSD